MHRSGAIHNVHLGGESNGGGPNFLSECGFRRNTTNHGIEQPVWNAKTQMFYLALPGTAENPAGEVDEIDPAGQLIRRVFPTTCSPAGLAVVPRQRLVTSCGDVIDIASGNVLTTVANVGADEIWFNSGEEYVYFGGFQGINVPVLDTADNTVVATLVVGVINPTPPPPFLQSTHSVAADSENNIVFVPVTNAGVKVYTARRRSIDEDD